jgi:hypothetical protein
VFEFCNFITVLEYGLTLIVEKVGTVVES